jgi:hypothetical protein
MLLLLGLGGTCRVVGLCNLADAAVVGGGGDDDGSGVRAVTSFDAGDASRSRDDVCTVPSTMDEGE